MPVLDFTEIAIAHRGAERDQFELFARDFFEAVGFEIVRGPDRGPDAGRDLIVRDNRKGASGTTTVDFLVSCKHKASSGTAVGESDDQNIRDRVGTHNCQGFIAFYSTVPSSTLATHLAALPFEVVIFDPEKIEGALLAYPQGRAVAARYLPKSFNRWIANSQYAAIPSPPSSLPVTDRYFLRQPHTLLADAKKEAEARGIPLFVVIYDPDHSSRSRLEYCLGNFMDWETNKRLVDEHFVPVVGPSSDPELGALVPDDDPLEECRLVIFDEAKVYKTESVYASAKEARKRLLSVLEMMKK